MLQPTPCHRVTVGTIVLSLCSPTCLLIYMIVTVWNVNVIWETLSNQIICFSVALTEVNQTYAFLYIVYMYIYVFEPGTNERLATYCEWPSIGFVRIYFYQLGSRLGCSAIRRLLLSGHCFNISLFWASGRIKVTGLGYPRILLWPQIRSYLVWMKCKQQLCAGFHWMGMG